MDRSKQDYIFECENGTVYGIPKNTKCCLICKHCTSILYDYTNGPYMFSCGIGEKEEECMNCNSFELEEGTMTVEEYEAKINSPEYIEKQRIAKEIADEMIAKMSEDENFTSKMFNLRFSQNAIKVAKGFLKNIFGKENK